MAKKTEESFGERIQRLRKAKGISIEALSHDTGYPEDFLKDIEEDKVAPPVAVVLQLNRILNVDVDRLRGAKGARTSRGYGVVSAGWRLLHAW